MRPVRPSDRGPAVEDIQRRLLALGYDLGPTGVDGVFLGQTAEAVRSFQLSHGLSEDGVVGEETWSALVDAGFTLGDIQTAVRFGTPYVAVVAHDSAWGIVADGQAEGRQAGSWLGEIRFDKVAEALGAKGVFIEDAKQIAPAIKAGLKSRTPTFIHVPTTIYGIRSYRRRFAARVREKR